MLAADVVSRYWRLVLKVLPLLNVSLKFLVEMS